MVFLHSITIRNRKRLSKSLNLIKAIAPNLQQSSYFIVKHWAPSPQVRKEAETQLPSIQHCTEWDKKKIRQRIYWIEKK